MQGLLSACLAVAMIGAVAPRPVLDFTRLWNAEQKTAWQTIEDHWAQLVKGDVEKFLSYIHPRFTGFGHESPLLIDKEQLTRWVGFWIKSITIPVYELQPVSVSEYGDFAVVHYYVFALEKGEVSAQRTVRRYTTTLIKEDGRWLIIGNQNQLMPNNW